MGDQKCVWGAGGRRALEKHVWPIAEQCTPPHFIIFAFISLDICDLF